MSKLVAYREKDRAFAAALLGAGLVEAATLRDRIDSLPGDLDERVPALLRAWLDAQVADA